MSLLAWIILGLFAGVLASLIMPAQTNILIDIIVGIVGATIGGYIFNAMGEPGVTGLNLYSLGVAVVGAVVLLALIRVLQRKPA